MPYAFNDDRSKYDLSQKADVNSLSEKSDVGHTHDISDLIGILPVSMGGTGSNTRLGSLSNLGFVKLEKDITLTGNTGTAEWTADELREVGIETPEDAVVVSLMSKPKPYEYWSTVRTQTSEGVTTETIMAVIENDAMGSSTALLVRVYGGATEQTVRVVLLDMSMELFPFGD